MVKKMKQSKVKRSRNTKRWRARGGQGPWEVRVGERPAQVRGWVRALQAEARPEQRLEAARREGWRRL